MGALIIQPVPQGVQHEGDYARFLATRCCIRVRTVLEVVLVHIVIVSGNPKNHVLALYVSIEPSENVTRFRNTIWHIV